MISKKTVRDYQTQMWLYSDLKKNTQILYKMGFSEKKLQRSRKEVNEYLSSIADPVKRDAMKAVICTGCNPAIAAQLAIKHAGFYDSNGKKARSLILFIKNQQEMFK